MKRVLPALAVLALGACAVGPDYHLPDEAAVKAPQAQGSFQGADGKNAVLAPVPDGWWKLYDDPRLNALEEQALAANTDLRVAAANLSQCPGGAARGRRKQEIEGGAHFAAERTQLSGESYLLPDQLPSQNLGDGGVQIAYQLDLFGRLKRAAEAAGADTEAVAAAQEAGADQRCRRSGARLCRRLLGGL